MASDLGTLFVNVGARIDGLEKGMAKATRTVQQSVGSMQSTIATTANGTATATSSVAKLATQTTRFGLTADQSKFALGRLNSELAGIAARSVGVSSSVGKLITTLGGFAVGGGVIGGALVAINLLGLAWQKYREAQENATKGTRDAITSLLALAASRRQGAFGDLPDKGLAALERRKQLLEDIAHQQKLVDIAKFNRVTGGPVFEKMKELRAELEKADEAVGEFKTKMFEVDAGLRKAAADSPFPKMKKDALDAADAIQAINRALYDQLKAQEDLEKFLKEPLKGLSRGTTFQGPFGRGAQPVAERFDASEEGAVVGQQSAVGAAGAQQFAFAMDGIVNLVASLGPLGIVATLLQGVFEGLAPVIEAVKEPIRLVGQIFGAALAPVLKAMFPLFKYVAIAATYVGQIFFKVAEGVAKAFGALIYAIGVVVKLLPLDRGLGERIKSVGKGIMAFGDAMGESADEMAKGRDQLKDLDWDDVYEPAKEAAESFGEALNNVASGFKVALRSFQATTGRGVVVQGDLHVHGVEDPKGMTDAVETESRRRMARGGTGIVLGYA